MATPAFNPKRPFGEIIGEHDTVPNARYEQNNAFYDASGKYIGPTPTQYEPKVVEEEDDEPLGDIDGEMVGAHKIIFGESGNFVQVNGDISLKEYKQIFKVLGVDVPSSVNTKSKLNDLLEQNVTVI